MKKRITYEINGQIERNSYFRIGKALVRIEFTGGAINSTGVYPAQYTTDNALFQRAIENSDAFMKGEIKRGRVEVLDDGNNIAVTEIEMKSYGFKVGLRTSPNECDIWFNKDGSVRKDCDY